MRLNKSLCLLSLFIAASLCRADQDVETIQVVGFGECADCKENNIETSHAFSELRVTIDCKQDNGKMHTRGTGELDGEGKFQVSVPKEIVNENGGLKEECYAQLHGASAAPCPAHNGIESSKIGLGKQGLEPADKVRFSSAICTSAFLFHKKPFFKKPIPFYKPKPKIPIYFKPKPKPKPPVYFYKPKPKPFHPIPIYKPKPKPPVYYKPLPPHIP